MSERSTVSTDHDPDDAPRLTREIADRAQLAVGAQILREADPPLARGRGRPPKPASERKELVSLRLSREVLDWFRATGPGWQTRIDELLRREVRGRSQTGRS
jgi:uncharacterized protein (DUF4415 family)